MYANLAIALTAPTDVSETRSVARTLPVVNDNACGGDCCGGGDCS
jgi:hypothetical protein